MHTYAFKLSIRPEIVRNLSYNGAGLNLELLKQIFMPPPQASTREPSSASTDNS